MCVKGYLKAAAQLAGELVKHPGEGLSYELAGQLQAYELQKAANSYELVNFVSLLVYAVDFNKEVSVNLCYCVVFNHRFVGLSVFCYCVPQEFLLTLCLVLKHDAKLVN